MAVKRLGWREKAEQAKHLTPEMAEIVVGSRVIRACDVGRGRHVQRGTVVVIHEPFERYANEWKPWSATVEWDRTAYSRRTFRSRLALSTLRLEREA